MTDMEIREHEQDGVYIQLNQHTAMDKPAWFCCFHVLCIKIGKKLLMSYHVKQVLGILTLKVSENI